MGLLSKLGGAIKETARGAAVNGILNATGNGAMAGAGNSAYEYDANGHIKGVNTSYVSEVESRYAGYDSDDIMAQYYGNQFAIDGKYGGLTTSTARKNPTNVSDDYPLKYSGNTFKSTSGLLLNDKGPNTLTDYNKNKITEDPISDIIQLKLPDWNYADFINERAIWQKGLSSIFDEPAWFYFKIFFDFNTNHGLFGGLLNSTYLTSATNSAAKYLYTVRKFHKQEKPKDRINALYKFTSILSYINTNAPWYFKSIKNLNNAALPVINEYSKERFIEIETMPDAIDMRLSTLMSLYSYACYDTILGKEIIPANLRKFNMTIILFQTPLRYLHTSYITNEKMEFMGVNLTGIANMFGGKNKQFDKVNYKSMNPSNGQTGNWGDTMSMHAFTFYGCEFDINSLGNMIPSQMTNENPFQLGANTIKINYTSCMQHTMNEFYAMMYGTDGFYFNQYSNFLLSNNWNGYVNTNKNTWSKQESRYKTLSNLFENIMSGGTILGLVDSPTTYKRAIDATEALMNGLYEDNNILKDIGTNFALGLLGSSQNTDAPQGNLYGDYGINSAYFKDKVDMLKNGVHERTTAPYYYDPDTGVRKDLHVSRSYSAYNYKNDVNAISSFNVTNWLDTTTQKFASKLNDLGRDVEGWFIDTIQGNHISTTAPYKPNQYNKETANQIDAKKFEGVGKSHDMVDDPNDWNRVEKPYTYDPQKAVDYENSKAGDVGKIQNMVDEIGNPIHQVTEKPFNYEPVNAVDYENNKAGDVGKIQNMVDEIGNPIHQVTEKPFNYEPVNAVDYENSKAGDVGKIQNMVDEIGNPIHQVTEKPFNYEPKEAINYENSKAGDVGKIQNMVDEIGNPIHQVTEVPFNYEPVNAVNYENSKAGGQYKTQAMVDGIGNPEHEVTEVPFNYEPVNAVNYENSKAGGQYKTQAMVDGIGNPEHEVTEVPFNYEPKEAVNYENSKAGEQYKTQAMVDGIGNPEHEVTEVPFNYEPVNAVNYENSKAGGQYKTQAMVDGIGNPEHEVTEVPFNYEPVNAVNYENSKAGGQYKTQAMVDGIGNPEHEVTEVPFNYEPKEAVNYENSKAGGQYKTQAMVDGIGNPEHEVTEVPFNYEPKEAVNYENSKAGGQYKTQAMVDGIGNPEHEVTEVPFNYEPVNAVNYENSKAGGEGKSQLMTDGIGNPEHEMTEAPFDYDPMNAVNYENSKAGGEGKSQLMTDGIGNAEHEMTEAPFDYDPMNAVNYESNKVNTKIDSQSMTEPPFDYNPMNAVNYENSKAGGEGKSQLMTDGIGNPVHQYSLPPFSYDSSNAIKYEQNKKANT